VSEATWPQYVGAIGSVATPLVVLVLAGVGWRFRAGIERRFAQEDKLREDRIGTYNKILEPFVLLLMSDAAWRSDPKNKDTDKNDRATRIMLSLDYRSYGMRLALVGSDSVVRAYNDLFQFFYQRGERPGPSGPDEIREMMRYLGGFLLEIRRSMGNTSTKLDHWDMLEWFINDARKYRS